MNYWILQDQQGVSLRVKLSRYNSQEVWWWNVDRYFHTTSPSLELGDIVLLWQTETRSSEAGIYAVGSIVRAPYQFPDDKFHWRVDIILAKILEKPILKRHLFARRDPEIKKLPILQMPGGHVVFPVSPLQWERLVAFFSELRI